jgi:flagellar biosynthesis/type III secretory pathway ATPase
VPHFVFSDDHSVLAEVVGFHEAGVLLMPLGDLGRPASRKFRAPVGRSFGVDVGPGCSDGAQWTRSSDRRTGKLDMKERVPLSAEPPHPLSVVASPKRWRPAFRAIDGHPNDRPRSRMGIFSGSGVGKSTLLGMIARPATADVNVSPCLASADAKSASSSITR